MTSDSTENLQSAELLDELEEEALDEVMEAPVSKKSTALRRVSTGLNTLVKIMFLTTFIVGYLEYRSALRERKINAAFELITNWEVGGFQTAYEVVSFEINRMRAEFADQFPDELSNPALERAYLSNQILQLVETDKGFDQNVGKVFYFYGKIGICIQQGICNRGMLHGFFHSSAVDFLYYFQSYAENKRASGQPDFAQYAEAFVDTKP